MRLRIALAALVAVLSLSLPASAEPIGFSAAGLQAQATHSPERHSDHHHARMASRRAHGPSQAASGPGIVRSAKTGATAHVAARFAAKAQAVIDDLEQHYGATIKFMGGYRPGPCASWSLHPCGLAIDLCQLGRGVVDPRCHMPSRAIEIEVARRHGAWSGGEWCNQDRGHIQAEETAARCGHNLYAAVSEFKAKRRHGARIARR